MANKSVLDAQLVRPQGEDDSVDGAEPTTLGELMDGRRTVVALLRRFGCVLCREGAAELSRIKAELDAAGVGMVAVGHEPLGYREFVEGGFFDGPVLVSPDKELYKALGAGRASKLSMLRPAVWRNISRAKAKEKGGKKLGGNLAGDGFQLGGVAVVDPDGSVPFSRPQKLIGEHCPTADVLAAAVGEGGAPIGADKGAEEPSAEELAAANAEVDRVVEAGGAHVFGHSRCKYSDRAKRVFRESLGVPFGSTDLDDAAQVEPARARALKWALVERTSSATFPWVFADGEFVGGGDDTMQRFLDGGFDAMAARLKAVDVDAAKA